MTTILALASAPRALKAWLRKEGKATPDRIAMMITTTNSSTNVKPTFSIF